MAHSDLAGNSGNRGRNGRVLRQVIPHQTHGTIPSSRINLLRHEQHPLNSKECGNKPEALQGVK
jgi:hypothetical protein